MAKKTAAQLAYDAMSEEDKAKYDALSPEDKAKADEAAELAAKEKAEAEKAAKDKVEVRVLTDCHHGKCGSVAKLNKEEVKAAEANGLVDSNPKAVKAAKG